MMAARRNPSDGGLESILGVWRRGVGCGCVWVCVGCVAAWGRCVRVRAREGEEGASKGVSNLLSALRRGS